MRFVAGVDRGQWTMLPESLDDFIAESNPVRVVDDLRRRARSG
jgi:transposase